MKQHAKPLLILTALCAVLFAFRLSAYGLLDPDEPFYALTAKEMLSAGNWLVPTIFGHAQFEKPILFYWLEMASFKFLGVNELAARLAPCVFGFLTVFLTYAWAQAIFRDKKTSFLAALILATAAETVVCSRVVLTDMVFTFFVTAVWLSFSLGRIRWMFFFAALASLTKGPLGMMIPFSGITAFLLMNGEKEKIPQMYLKGFWIFLLVAVPWYVYMTMRFGTGYLYDFFIHENVRRFFVAEHKSADNAFFYPLGLWAGFFPWGVFLPAALIYGARKARKRFLFLSLAFWAPFIFLSLAKSKLLSYIFPLYPVAAILISAWGVRAARAAKRQLNFNNGLKFSVFLGWGIFPVLLTAGTIFYCAKNEAQALPPAIAIGCLVVPLCWAALYFFFAKHFFKMAACLTAMVAGFSMLAFSWLMPAAQPLFSSKDWVGLSEGSRLILASKLYVRGVSFYRKTAGHEAVFIENPARAFYTRHSIPILSTQNELLEIPKEDYPVYGFLRQKELAHLKSLLDPRFRLEILKEDTVRVLVRLHRTGEPA